MGAWGAGNFENDAAADWALDLVEVGAESAIDEAIDGVLDVPADDYLEADSAVLALAAAEVVAALGGRPCEDLPEPVAAWVAGRERPSPELVRKARAVVARVTVDGELRDLWDEAGELDVWLAALRDLELRLPDGPGSGGSHRVG